MRLSLFAVLLACGTIASDAMAQTSSTTREASYRCRDINGHIQMGSAMPVECQGRDTDVLNERGTVLRVIEGAGTRSNRVEREADEAARQRKKEEQFQRDKVLIETYLSVEEIERLRDQRLDLLTAQLKVAEQHIASLRERMVRLREQSNRFKPYSDKTNAPPMPDHLAEELIGTVKSLAVDEQTIQIKRDDQASMTTNFDRDIKRFKELKGIK